jgi:hypothetical protein
MSALPPKADIRRRGRDVRFVLASRALASFLRKLPQPVRTEE